MCWLCQSLNFFLDIFRYSYMSVSYECLWNVLHLFCRNTEVSFGTKHANLNVNRDTTKQRQHWLRSTYWPSYYTGVYSLPLQSMYISLVSPTRLLPRFLPTTQVLPLFKLLYIRISMHFTLKLNNNYIFIRYMNQFIFK